HTQCAYQQICVRGPRRSVSRCSRAVLFFFSSRRRHTRSTRDWSSDVCSSDLQAPPAPVLAAGSVAMTTTEVRRSARASGSALSRSEERRVGKECRARWWPWQEKKKDWTPEATATARLRDDHAGRAQRLGTGAT